MQKIIIPKSIVNRPDYLGEKFSRPAAWIDLLLTANNEGHLSFTISGLAKRWKWQRRDVKSFLKELESNCAINCAFNCAAPHPGRYSLLNLTICNIARYTFPCTIDSIGQPIEQLNGFQKSSPLSPSTVSPNLPPTPPTYTPSYTPPISPSEKHVSGQDASAQAHEEGHPPTPFHFRTAIIGLGVEPKVADDWLKVRKAKKGVNTETAFKAIEREVKKAIEAGYSANDCILLAAEKSWVGFNLEWALKIWKSQQQAQPPSRIEQYMQTSQNFSALVNEFFSPNVRGAGNGPANSPDEQ